jgi:amino acid transporter
VLCAYFFVQVSFENISYENLWHDTATNPASYVFAFYGAFWAYSGFDGVGFIVEEITQPLKRNITLSVTFSIVVVIAIYVLSTITTIRLKSSLLKYPSGISENRAI